MAPARERGPSRTAASPSTPHIATPSVARPPPALERVDGIHDAQTPAPVRKSGAGAACRDPGDRLARSLVALIAALLPLLVVDLPLLARRREPETFSTHPRPALTPPT